MFFNECHLHRPYGRVFSTFCTFMFLMCSLSHAHRVDQYVFSVEFVQEINSLAQTWEAGHNFPISMTYEELGFLLDLSEPPANRSIYRSNHSESEASPSDDSFTVTDIPQSFDARVHWAHCPDIGKVYDQGACPSSYAFAVAPAFSDRRCIQSNGQQSEPMSIDYLLSCCHSCKFNDTTRECGAGQAITAWWFLHKRGVVSGGEYGSSKGCQPLSFPPCHRVFSSEGASCTDQKKPQLHCHTRCTNVDYDIPYSQDRHRAMIQYFVATKEDSIKLEILNHGPVTAQITTYEDFLHYKSGVYKHTTGERFPHQHTLKLIGWGVENDTPYWLLINSWGKSWGDEGTFKILRGAAECNLEYYVTAALPKRY
uniref:Cathepsin B n=1 Tax=Cacopsylla melanoneura TaxID=428564 RepID=A0A8D9F9L2_9HEMI